MDQNLLEGISSGGFYCKHKTQLEDVGRPLRKARDHNKDSTTAA